MVSNPQRYKSRFELYERFKKGCDNAGVNLLMVEVALGDRPFELTDASSKNHVQLRTRDELWHKEAAWNVGTSRLPADCKKILYVDADVEFMRHDWPAEICHLLEQYKVIQPFQTAVDLGPSGHARNISDGFVYSWMTGAPKPFSLNGSGPHWHPGYGIAMTRDVFDGIGGHIDWAILGSGDHHFWHSMIGKGVEEAPKKMSQAYRRRLSIYQDRALKHVRQNIGYMEGSIYHHWHGSKKLRRYRERWDILFAHNYDPDVDLQRDWQGLTMLSDQGERMRNDLRGYFSARSEDSIEL